MSTLLSKNMKEQNMNMLYCGMANDITTPFSLPIEFDKLYVMDIFDPAFSSDFTFEGQKKDILSQLTAGQRPKNKYWKGLKSRLKDKPNSPNLQKEFAEYESKFTPCRIISEKTEKNKWSILLEQNNKQKEIIIFYTNFCNKWPEEIQDISFLTSLEAVFPLSNNPTLNDMVESRCTKDCIFYFAHHSLYNNKNAVHLFSEINSNLLSCPINTHLPLLKYLFVDDANKNNIQEIPKDLINSYQKKKIKP